MPIQDLKQEIAHAPEQPGVYLFLGRAGDTLYVGKAAVLRDRLRSYLGAWGASPRIDALLAEADALEFVVTDSAVDALVLENNLIKQRLPRYNIRLRDDKNYPYLRLTTSEAFPRVMVARRAERDGNLYAGPFLPASLARRSISLAHRLFGLRSCNEEITGKRDRPCLEYEIGRCVAPCVDTICSAPQYRAAVDRTRLLLEGRTTELIARLEEDMRAAAEAERFEHAAHLRDAVRTLGQLRDRQQRMSTARVGDRDAIGVKTGPTGSVIQVFQMRGGRVIDRVELVADSETGQTESETDVLEAAIPQFYADRDVPPEIHVAWRLDAAPVLEAWLSDRAGRRVDVLVPRTAERRGLLDLATRNAALAYHRASAAARSPTTRPSTSCARCWRCRRSRGASSVSTSRRCRAPTRWPRSSSARTAACGRASTASSASAGRRSTTSPRCARWSAAATPGSSSRGRRTRISS